LAGESNDEEPFTTDLYLTSAYASDATNPMPPWFYNLLMGPTPAFHTLHKAMVDQECWNSLAEIECYCQIDNRCCCLESEWNHVHTKLKLVNNTLQACHYCLEAGHLPNKVRNLKGHAGTSAQEPINVNLPKPASSSVAPLDQEIQSRQEGDVIILYQWFKVVVFGKKRRH
jgi:hypothetical protein